MAVNNYTVLPTQSIPLSLDLAFTQGYIRTLKITGTSGTARPDKGYLWILLDGVIHHAGGNTTDLHVWTQTSTTTYDYSSRLAHIDSTIKEDYYPLWPVVSADSPNSTASLKTYFSLYNLCVITEDMLILLIGDALDWANLKILEWQIPTRH